ncbi:hypothetical protein ACFO25_14120 [Paenactinomyces guangxiensis]|uniref:Protein kinase domain-containing protein n=1 Tax=Paenactinomyces guangxiensis TaxID=1490290 RepID=A0A7W2A7X6_9BACL|nr:hypothetical protein [Paenactinomyces guangxiensis]MBA4493577.1 hypothetical protein [Paenactinomyces guangxiensis]MBH8590668.1 hypothetical protein [Paenactinomyces guangxiensis]
MKPSFAMDQEAVDYLNAIVASGKIAESCSLLGEGLSGKVYDFEGYAVKVYKENFCENDDHLMLARLHDHPAFPVLQYKGQNHQFMVADKVSGYTLAEILKSGEKLNEHTFRQIERHVEDCYREGIIPHDLHLNNIMIDHDKNVKIVDTGRFFYSDDKGVFKDKIETDLEMLKYHLGLFGFFSSSRRKYRRHRKHSYSSRSYSSRSYSSSRRRHRRRRKYHSYSSS